MADVDALAHAQGNQDDQRHEEEDFRAARRGRAPGGGEARGKEHEEGQRGLQGKGRGEVVPPPALGVLAEEEGRPALDVHEEVLEAPDPGLRQHSRAAHPAEQGLKARAPELDGPPVEDPRVGLRIDGEGGMEAIGRPHRGHRHDPHGQKDEAEDRELAGAGGHLGRPAASVQGERGSVESNGERGQAQHGQEPQARELGGAGRTDGAAGKGHPQGSDSVDHTEEGHHREEGEEGDAEVGAHDRAMGEQVRIERAQEKGEQGRVLSVARPREGKDRGEEDDAEGHDGQATPEEEALGVVPSVEEPLAEFPGAADLEGEVVALPLHVEEEEGQGGEAPHQGRVVGVQPMVAESQAQVAGGQVDDLVEGRGLGPRGRDGQAGVDR